MLLNKTAPTSCICQAYGCCFVLRTNNPARLEEVRAALPHGTRPAPTGTPDSTVERRFFLEHDPVAGHRLYAEAECLAHTRDWAALLAFFEAHVRLYVAEFARRHVFVHAGVVGWRGRALLLPGRSFSGKTTLVAALLRAGATYYSDEYAVLDRRGRVHPYTQPLQIRVPGEHRQTAQAAAAFGGRLGRAPLPIGWVWLSQYQPQTRWQLRSLTTGQGVLALLTHTVSARRSPGTALTTLQRAIAAAQVWQGPRGEASSTAPELLDWLASTPAFHQGIPQQTTITPGEPFYAEVL